jgi:predicted SnoaL-like aldol condensation-catalyzing enzyme
MNLTKLATSTALAVGLSAATIAMASAASTKDIVTNALSEVMIKKNTAAIDTYFAEPYIQHNQQVPTGLAAFKGLADQAIAKNPAFKYKMIRVFADGNIGIAHGIYEGFAKVPLVGFDIFRIENGKIVEHWDNLSPVAANNPSGRSQTDGPTEVTDLDKTEANKKLVSEFVNVLVTGDFAKMPDFVDGDNYIQHNSQIADGLSGLGAGLKKLAEAGITMRFTKNYKIYGEGNFVLAVSEGEFASKPTAFYDLFRVKNGKITEHWDVISTIVADDKAANKNGKF